MAPQTHLYIQPKNAPFIHIHIYIIHRDLFILLATFFPLILLPLKSLVLFILPPSQRDTMRLPFYSISKSPFFLFLSLFELSHFIRVDKTIFYPCKIKKVPSDCYRRPACTMKSHISYTSRGPRYVNGKKRMLNDHLVYLGSGSSIFPLSPSLSRHIHS